MLVLYTFLSWFITKFSFLYTVQHHKLIVFVLICNSFLMGKRNATLVCVLRTTKWVAAVCSIAMALIACFVSSLMADLLLQECGTVLHK